MQHFKGHSKPNMSVARQQKSLFAEMLSHPKPEQVAQDV